MMAAAESHGQRRRASRGRAASASCWLVLLLLLLLACFSGSASAFTQFSPRSMLRKGLAARANGPPQQLRQQMKQKMMRLGAISGGGEGGKSPAADDEAAKKASMRDSIFNLIKCISGSGMLSLPAGLAAYSSHPSAIIPAALIITGLGGISAYTFCSIGRACSEVDADTYEKAWAKTVSKKSAAVPAAACVATCFAGCLAFTLIACDSFTSLFSTFGLGGLLVNRNVLILLMSVFIFLPLSLMKSLSSLGFTSMLGTGGLLYTAFVMGLRYFDGSYRPGGKFAAALLPANAPVFASQPGGRPLLFLVLVSMLGTAFEAHFNAPLFFRELKDNTPERFNTMVSWSFVTAVVTMICVTAFGFLTFGGASQGFILNNYAANDLLVVWARAFVGVGIVFSYPLCFVGLRDGILEMKGIDKPSEKTRNVWTVGLLSLVSVCSVFLRDLGFVNSFGGALISSLIVYVFPAIMFVMMSRKRMAQGLSKGMAKLSGAIGFESAANYGIVILGIAMGILGAGVSVLETFFPHVLGL
jgi:amino acid permease